jgi:GMP synthase-like glutamine amidotransferase
MAGVFLFWFGRPRGIAETDDPRLARSCYEIVTVRFGLGSFLHSVPVAAKQPAVMRIHSLEHQSSEGPGKIADWAAARGYSIARTALYADEPAPSLDAFDLLVVMGGGMNIYQHRDYPWLVKEKEFLRLAIEAGKPILGVCLGAQLLADVLGGKVYQNPEKEIGWFPVEITDRRAPFSAFPARMNVMHWHGDTFDLPAGARVVAESAGCPRQAFVFGDRVVGLQFHLEMGAVHVADLANVSMEELVPARYVQSPEQLMQTPADLAASHDALFTLLDELALRPPTQRASAPPAP